MRFRRFNGGIVLELILSTALVGCGSSQEANAPTGGTSTTAPAPGAGTPAPTPTGPAAGTSTPQPPATGTASGEAGTPKITEKPAEPTSTPKEATEKGGTEKGGVKPEQPPRGA